MYLMYLRKSREDTEALPGETLKRHRNILDDLCQKQGIVIPENCIFKEVVSGETIDARPEMKKLLSVVETGEVEGVVVVEIERLARGDSVDQGIISKTFGYTHTKIITPMRTYDPDNEMDSEYFEFGLFMARREYAMITRRLRRGKHQSTKEGHFIGSVPPFGYDKVKCEGKGYTLRPNENAKYVVMIFEMARDGSGGKEIASRLNSLGVHSTSGGDFNTGGIAKILHNKTYCGYVSWQYRVEEKTIKDGVVVKNRRLNKDGCEWHKALHEAIISEELFEAAQRARANRNTAPIHTTKNMRNPYAGLIKCGKCGKAIVMSKNRNGAYSLRCMECDNSSVMYEKFNAEVMEALKGWLGDYAIESKASVVPVDTYQEQLDDVRKNIENIDKKIEKICVFLEDGVYTKEMFVSRSNELRLQRSVMVDTASQLEETIKSLSDTSKAEIVPKIERVIDAYDTLSTEDKNKLLKEIIDKIIYTRNSRFDEPIIEVFPKINKYQ